MRLRTALLVICSATALAVVPAAAGDEPATLENLPAVPGRRAPRRAGRPVERHPRGRRDPRRGPQRPGGRDRRRQRRLGGRGRRAGFRQPDGPGDCLSGRTCLWENASYGGAMLSFTATSTVIDLAGLRLGQPRIVVGQQAGRRRAARHAGPAPATGPRRASCACRRTPRPPRWAAGTTPRTSSAWRPAAPPADRGPALSNGHTGPD